MHSIPRKQLLQRFFAGVTQSAFLERIGLADPPLVDYISDLLLRFVHVDDLHRVRNPTGRRLVQVSEMVAEAEQRIGPARREVHRHIGDYTLFWVGMYPEALYRLRSPDRKDYFIDYSEQGKLSYRIAAAQEEKESDEESVLFLRLSEQFELCSRGLFEVRRELARRDDDVGSIILF
ncbi:MAG: hypothetical protein HYS13_23385 [Planctomycetia bacterium]|nr:hypothetical protein [Planctomycetia bacterium]